MAFLAGDQAYQFEVDVDLDDEAQGGVLLFYNDKLYAGLGINAKSFVLHRYGMDQRTSPKPAGMRNALRSTISPNLAEQLRLQAADLFPAAGGSSPGKENSRI